MQKILVIRNDKLGDFMLAWPALSLLKSKYPDCEISALVPAYTRPMAELCPWIDKVIIDENPQAVIQGAFKLARKLRPFAFDAAISIFTETRTALACFLAGIPVRVSPATKIAQIFSNKRLKQRRSKSVKAEHEYNTELANYYIQSRGDTAGMPSRPPYLKFDPALINDLRNQYIISHLNNDKKLLIILHPGTGGSAINLSVEQYAELIHGIVNNTDAHFIITAGPGEEETAKSLSSLIHDVSHYVYSSEEGIVAFSQFIATSDLFISGSTGTLHIAGALDIPTAAFYPARKSATALRWKTLNSDDRRLVFSPDKYTGEDDMKTIDTVNCANKISVFLKQLYPGSVTDKD